MAFLITFLPYYILANIVLIIILLSFNLKHIKPIFSKITRKHYFYLLAVVLLFLILGVLISPWHHLLYFDEWESMESGRQLLLTGKFAICNSGNLENCRARVMPPHPISLSAAISSSYLLLGIGHFQAKIVIFVFGAISVIIMFFLSYLLFNNPRTSIWTSFIFALFPIHILYATSVSSDVFSVSFTLISVFLFLVFIRLGTISSLLLALSSTAFAIQIRQELLVILLFYLVLYVLFKPSISARRIILPLAGFFSFVIVHIVYIYETTRWKHYISKELVFSLSNISKNLYYVTFWFDDFQHFIVTTLAIIGIILLLKSKRKLLFLSMWFFSFFIIYILYWFNNEDRYMITLYPAVALLAGVAVEKITQLFNQKLAIASILLIFLTAFVYSIPSILASSPPHRDYYKEEIFLEKLRSKMPELDGPIVTAAPYIINFEFDTDAIKSDKQSSISALITQNKKIYFYENVFCFIPPSASICDALHKQYKLKKLYSMPLFSHSSSFYEIVGIK